MPLIIAHRGASADAPENSLAAFTTGFAQGADGIEGDFHLSRDGHIVCIHDDDTARVAGTDWRVRDKTLAQLQTLNIAAHRPDFDKPQTIPTLAEVCATVPDAKSIQIEIKCKEEIIPVLIEQLTDIPMRTQQISIISFYPQVIQEMKKRAPDYCAILLAEFGDRDGNNQPAVDVVLQALQQTGADGLGSGGTIARRTSDAVLAAGYIWNAWTIDDADTARDLRARGVHSITTNRPARLRADIG